MKRKLSLTAILFTIGLPFFILVISFAPACQSQPAPVQECESTVFNADPLKMEITQQVTFDTTANMFRAQIVDRADGKAIQGAAYNLWQGSSVYKGLTDANGEFDVFENQLSGNWQLKISDSDYVCLEVKDIPMNGGQTAIVRLRKK